MNVLGLYEYCYFGYVWGLKKILVYPSFSEEHNLSTQSYLLSLSKSIEVDYISSPEIGLLQAIAPRYEEQV